MAHWSTSDLSAVPAKLSPSGAAEIREFPDFERGQIAHATVQAGTTGDAAVLSDITEFFYVLAGSGELWRGHGEISDVVDLHPQRCVTIPPGVCFQYLTTSEPLTFLVASAPRWRIEYWHESSVAHWPDGELTAATDPADIPWKTCDLPKEPNYRAPDGSEIRLLPSVPAGGLAHCLLPGGRTSHAVRHRTVEEIWYVLSGSGELWREAADDEEIVDLRTGRVVTIPTGTTFQFRAQRDPLEIIIGTFPEWPGEDEADPVWIASMLERARASVQDA